MDKQTEDRIAKRATRLNELYDLKDAMSAYDPSIEMVTQEIILLENEREITNIGTKENPIWKDTK
jgi:hypothetical protein